MAVPEVFAAVVVFVVVVVDSEEAAAGANEWMFCKRAAIRPCDAADRLGKN